MIEDVAGGAKPSLAGHLPEYEVTRSSGILSAIAFEVKRDCQVRAARPEGASG